MRRGSDFAGAAKAFRAAQQWDPDDPAITGDLAVLLDTTTRRSVTPGMQNWMKQSQNTAN
jgi:hypothetical protein